MSTQYDELDRGASALPSRTRTRTRSRAPSTRSQTSDTGFKVPAVPASIATTPRVVGNRMLLSDLPRPSPRWSRKPQMQTFQITMLTATHQQAQLECFTYRDALLESPMAPAVVLATNRGNALVRGTADVVAPHGVPVDLLDRYGPSLLIYPAPHPDPRMLMRWRRIGV